MKLATLLLLTAAITGVSLAFSSRKFKSYVRGQQEFGPPIEYNLGWLCADALKIFDKVKMACRNLDKDDFEVKLHLPYWFCKDDKLEDSDIRQQLSWKCGIVLEKKAKLSVVDKQQDYGNEFASVWEKICTFHQLEETTLSTAELRVICSWVENHQVLTGLPSVCPNSITNTNVWEHLRLACRNAILSSAFVNIQRVVGMDYICQYHKMPGFTSHIDGFCYGYLPDKDIPEPIKNVICEKARSGRLTQYLDSVCSEEGANMPVGNQQYEPGMQDHEHICMALSNGDMGTVVDTLDRLCERMIRSPMEGMLPDSNGMTPSSERRFMETHWGLCVDEDRIETLCKAIEKGYLKCHSSEFPEMCRRF